MSEKELLKYGLKSEIIENICKLFSQFLEIDKVILYGSRAKGNYKVGSDIDLSFYCSPHPRNSLDFIIKLSLSLDDLNLAYSFDLSLFENIENEDLKGHINRVGKLFYQKASFLLEQEKKVKLNPIIDLEIQNFWQDKQKKSFEKLCKEEGLNSQKFKLLIDDFILTNQLPSDESIIDSLIEKPKLLKRKPIVLRVIKKLQDFIED
ncbi:MAG: hypothetical protein COB02_16010 [Candidatus Cloacimonadota bacterium]|nr:MAG: hypothetical protein COB02_16010 [Candidatus Cloacimonadota bacterium]